MRKTITFRIRQIDDDLARATANIDSTTLSDLCRDGLRLILGLTKTRRAEVVEREIKKAEIIRPIPAKPAVYIPPKTTPPNNSPRTR